MIPQTALRYGLLLALVATMAGGLAVTRGTEPASAAEATEVGIGYLLAGEMTLARDTLVRVLATDPKNFRALYGLGLVAFKQERYTEAERHMTAALAVKEDPETLLSLGAVYQKQKALEKAEAAYLAVRKISPEHAKVAYNLGALYVSARRLEDAHREYSTFLRLEPKSSQRFKVMKRLRLIEAHMKDKKN